MKKFILSISALIFIHFHILAQRDQVGSGRAIQFDGIDDYIDLGDKYDDLQLPFTTAAWVYLEETTEYIYPVFVSQDNAPLYNGFWFCLSASNLFIEYGDGRGEQNDAFRKGKSAPVNNLKNRWVYVSAVFNSASDIQLYANGFNVGGAYTGYSNQPMASNFPNDIAKVGYFFTNSVTHNYKGIMDELRIWNRSLSQQEVRETMCQKLKGDETGLIGYWTFDETSGDVLKDLSSKNYDGQLKGNPTRVFSGAPVGDESVYVYTSNWNGVALIKNDLSVSNISGSPYGVHIYQVNQIPSQTEGLDVTALEVPYYGVFLAHDGTDNVFDVSFKENTVCKTFQRKDNSESTWDSSEIFSGIHNRVEIIPSFETTDLEVNLGTDIILCDKTSFLLIAHQEPDGKTFLWNTSQTSSTITVTAPGVFSVEVKEDCMIDKDTIQVSFLKTPPAFSLGEDEVLCQIEPRTLNINLENNDFDFTWQDGSKEMTFQLTDFGLYWLKVSNACGISIDSLRVSQMELKDFMLYNFISPDNDDVLNQFFSLDHALQGSHLTVYNRWGKQVYQSVNYQNDWDGGDLPSGIYFYTINGACIETQKGTLTIMR